MKNKFQALLLSLFIIAVGFSGIYLVNKQKQDNTAIQGAQTQQNDGSLIGDAAVENRSERIPEVNLTDLLFALGQEAGLTITQVIDSSFKWDLEEDSLLVKGQGITVDNFSEEGLMKAIKHLEGTGFIQNEQNTTSDTNHENIGYKLKDLACLIRQVKTDEIQESTETGLETFITKLEIKCGKLNYEQYNEQPTDESD